MISGVDVDIGVVDFGVVVEVEVEVGVVVDVFEVSDEAEAFFYKFSSSFNPAFVGSNYYLSLGSRV